MAREKDAALEAMRWICILAVVCHHGISVQRQSTVTVAEIRMFQEWIQWCVAGFFLVSGYLQSPDRPLASQFLSRARRLLVPYLVVSLVAFTAVSALHYSGLQAYPEPETLTIPALATKLVWLAGFGPQLYFLPYLLVVWILVVPLMRVVHARWIFAIFTVLLAAQGLLWIFPLGVLGPGLDRLAAYALAFALGVSMRAWGRDREGAFTLVVVGGGVAVAILLGGSSWPLSLVLPVAMKWGLSRIPISKLVDSLGSLGRPGGIYLWHAPLILPACSKLIGVAGLVDWPNYVGSCLMASAVALAIDRVLSSFRATSWLTL